MPWLMSGYVSQVGISFGAGLIHPYGSPSTLMASLLVGLSQACTQALESLLQPLKFPSPFIRWLGGYTRKVGHAVPTLDIF